MHDNNSTKLLGSKRVIIKDIEVGEENVSSVKSIADEFSMSSCTINRIFGYGHMATL